MGGVKPFLESALKRHQRSGRLRLGLDWLGSEPSKGQGNFELF